MSTITSLISAGGGGGGTPINGIAKLNVDGDIYTDENSQVWLRSGKILTTGLSSYPDAEIKNDLISIATQLPGDIYTLSNPGTSIAQGFAFSPDGLNFYYLSWSTIIARMQLAEAYNLYSVTSKTYSSNISQGTDTAGFDISPDGTTLIICSGSSLKTYTLSTAFDTSNMTNVRNYAIGATGHGCRFASNGTKIFVAVGSSGIKELNLSTAYDTSTISDSGFTYSNGTTVNDITWREDGSSFYFADSNGNVWNYGVSVNFSFSGTESFIGTQAIATGAWSRAIWLIPDNTGTKMMVSSYDNDNQIRTWRMSTPYSIGTATYSTVPSFPAFQTATGSAYAEGDRVIYSYDGTKAHAWKYVGSVMMLYDFTLSTAFDLSSATYNSISLQIGSGDAGAGNYQLYWTNDGNNLCLFYKGFADSYKGKIWKAVTPYSLSGLTSTATYQTTTTLYGITCVNNGYQTYIADSLNNSVKSYAHAQYTPNFISELKIYNENGNYISLALEEYFNNNFSFSNDGKYFFWRGFQYLTETEYGLDLVSLVGFNADSGFSVNTVIDYDGYYGNGQPYLYKKNNYIGFFSKDQNEFIRIK